MTRPDFAEMARVWLQRTTSITSASPETETAIAEELARVWQLGVLHARTSNASAVDCQRCWDVKQGRISACPSHGPRSADDDQHCFTARGDHDWDTCQPTRTVAALVRKWTERLGCTAPEAYENVLLGFASTVTHAVNGAVLRARLQWMAEASPCCAPAAPPTLAQLRDWLREYAQDAVTFNPYEAEVLVGAAGVLDGAEPGAAPAADSDAGCDCDRFEGGEHTRLCASVAATRRRAARNASPTCDHGWATSDTAGTNCPTCNGGGCPPVPSRAEPSSSLDPATIEACAAVVDACVADCLANERRLASSTMDTFEWSSRAREALICAGAALAIDTLASVDHELRRLRTALMSIRDNRLSAADEKALARGLTEANEEIAKLRIEVGELLEGQRAQTDDSYRKGWADAFRAALKARTLQDGHTVALTKVKAT